MLKDLCWIAFGWTSLGLVLWGVSQFDPPKVEVETKPMGITERLIRGVAE